MNLRACLISAVLGGLCLLPSPAAFADDDVATATKAAERPVHLTGVIEVDAEGKVENVTLRRKELLPAVEERVLGEVRSWTFEPYLVDGVARRIRTSMSLRLDPVKAEDGYQLTFGAIDFGQPLLGNVTPPRYPTSALRDALSAHVLMLANVDGDGRVTSSEPVRAQIVGKRMRNPDHHRRVAEPFVQSAQAALTHWTFDFVEARTDGQPQRILVPVSYTTNVTTPTKAPNPPVLFDVPALADGALNELLMEADAGSESLPVDPQPSPLRRRTNGAVVSP